MSTPWPPVRKISLVAGDTPSTPGFPLCQSPCRSTGLRRPGAAPHGGNPCGAAVLALGARVGPSGTRRSTTAAVAAVGVRNEVAVVHRGTRGEQTSYLGTGFRRPSQFSIVEKTLAYVQVLVLGPAERCQ